MNGTCKLLCPVCKLTIKVQDFDNHVKKSNNHLYFRPFVNETTLNILYRASDLKNNSNYLYFNWKYYILLNYNLTEEDKKNYNDVRKAVELEKGKAEPEEIKKIMASLDKKYSIDIILDSIIILSKQLLLA